MEYAEEFIDLPSPEHVNAIMDGVIDTVSGSEGYGLTHAQHYLHGALFASGMIGGRDYHGNEGILDSIKNGLQKAWEYVTGMVKKVFTYFFSPGTKGEIKAVNEGLKELEKTADIKPTSDPVEAKAQVKAMISNTTKIVHDTEAAIEAGPKPAVKGGAPVPPPSQTTANDLKEGLSSLKSTLTEIIGKDGETPSPEEVKKASAEAIKTYEYVVKTSLSETTHDSVTHIAEERMVKMKALLEQLKTGEHPDFSMDSLVQATESLIHKMEQWPVALKEFRLMSDSRKYVAKTQSILNAVMHAQSGFTSAENHFNKKLREFKSFINQRDLSEGKRAELKASLQAAQKGINAIADIMETVRRFLGSCRFFIDRYNLQIKKLGL